jgi:hypothetical protein
VEEIIPQAMEEAGVAESTSPTGPRVTLRTLAVIHSAGHPKATT